MNNPGFIPDQDVLKKNRIDLNEPRRVIAFRCFVPMEKDLLSVFRDIAPMEPGDIMIPADFHTVAFIKEQKMHSKDELTDYAEAVIGTMESEGITGIKAGIGNEASGPESLRDSLREGLGAISGGMKYHSRDNVYVFEDQMLDRILDSIPRDARTEIRKSLFRSGPSGSLSDEMLETVRVFFQNDLNLTAASRQLFIHRNTLNYRLDKIKKETGLDLRSFEDAVIFRIISGIPAES